MGCPSSTVLLRSAFTAHRIASPAGLEAAVTGLKVGDKRKKTVQPEDAFGKSQFQYSDCGIGKGWERQKKGVNTSSRKQS